MIIVIGRGHSGTRIPSKLLVANGFKTGRMNGSMDMVPYEEMYCAVKLFTEKVKVVDDYEWDFDVGHYTPMFERLVKMYLRPLRQFKDSPTYFKLPETTLCYPWIVQMYPKAKYIHWIRDPRDYGWHLSDVFSRWRLPVPEAFVTKWTKQGIDVKRVTAAISCKYQWDIVENAPRPDNFIRIRYEDYCADQKYQLERLSDFVKKKLEPIETKLDSVGRWQQDKEHFHFPFWQGMLDRLGYG